MPQPAPSGPLAHPAALTTALAVLFGVTGLGSAAVAVALPVIWDDLGLTPGRAALVVSSYALALAVGSAILGRLGDIFGIRTPLVAGIVVMVAAASAGSLVDSLPALVVTRSLQGLGASAIPALTLASVQAAFVGDERARALASYAGTSAAMNALGPVLGALLADPFGWRPVVALPLLTLVVLPFVWRGLPTERQPGATLDVGGAVLVGLAATGALLSLQAVTLGRVPALAGAVVLVVTAPWVVLRSRWRPHGVVPATLVSHPLARRSLLTALSLASAWFGMLVAVPTALAARGWSTIAIGLLLVPCAALGVVAPRVIGPVLVRLGPVRGQLVSTAGTAAALLLAALGLLLLAPALVVVATLVLMLSFGLGQPAMTALVADSVPPGTRGGALGLLTLCFLMGGSLGAAAVGGLGEVIGLPRSLTLLTLLPLLGAASFARTPTPPPSPTTPHPRR